MTPSGDVDRRALGWHVFVWDMWSLLWGLTLALTVVAAWRDRSLRE